MKEDFLSPVGRFVQGDAFTPQTKNKTGQPLLDKNGQPRVSYFVGVAFRKDDPAFGAFYQKMVAVARAGFPNMIGPDGRASHPKFAWKLMDGDGVDDDGKPNNLKPGFAGHWVLKCGSGFPPKCFYAGRYQPHEQIQDPKAIPRGYYIRVAGTMEGNGDASKPGLYVNLSMVELVGGEPSMIIQGGPDASQVFGGAAPTLPAGVPPVAMGAPVAAPGNALPGMPSAMPMGQPGPTSYPSSGGYGAPAAVPSAMPGAVPAAPGNVLPNPAFLQGPGASAPPAYPGAVNAAPLSVPLTPPTAYAGPAAGTFPSSPGALPGMPVALPPAVAHVMLPAAQGHSYEALRQMGYTDEFMRANGMMQ
jgi:hypothetical protein